MKRLFLAAALIGAVAPVLAADVSISVGQPGFYGRIDLGDYPQPQLIYRNPLIIERASVTRAPIYLNVPPGHAKNWSKHCSRYDACGERVYFVQNSWYDREYVPHYATRQHEERDGRGEAHAPGRGNDQRDEGGRGEHGRGHGRGNGR